MNIYINHCKAIALLKNSRRSRLQIFSKTNWNMDEQGSHARNNRAISFYYYKGNVKSTKSYIPSAWAHEDYNTCQRSLDA